MYVALRIPSGGATVAVCPVPPRLLPSQEDCARPLPLVLYHCAAVLQAPRPLRPCPSGAAPRVPLLPAWPWPEQGARALAARSVWPG